MFCKLYQLELFLCLRRTWKAHHWRRERIKAKNNRKPKISLIFIFYSLSLPKTLRTILLSIYWTLLLIFQLNLPFQNYAIRVYTVERYQVSSESPEVYPHKNATGQIFSPVPSKCAFPSTRRLPVINPKENWQDTFENTR